MYEQHFGLTGLPFCLNPAEWQFFESASSAEIIPQIQHALSTASGVAIVTGPEGVGKTVLLHQLQALLARKGQAIVIPGTSLGTIDDLYVGIRRSLRTLDGSQVPGGCNRWEIVEHLRNSSEFWGPVAFLIDDAHLLTPGVFTELQFLLEQRSGPQTLCRLLLAGSLTLEETLAEPALHGFAQRIRAFTFLTPLRLAESVEYLRTRVKHAGGKLTTCFSSDAVELIVEAADGSPRCLNLLADESLMLTYQQEEAQVTRKTVVAALDHLKHLPHAWNVSVASEADSSLNDSVESSTSWESSSDGVIEIGAPPAEADVNQSEVSVEVGNVVEFGAPEPTPVLDEEYLDEEFPTLDELQQETVGDLEVAEMVAVDLEDEGDSEFTGMSFEDGYRLAELESVGTPSVEIDDDLDRRLLEAADSAAPSPSQGEAATDDIAAVEFDDILPEYRLWNPAGTWASQELLQDELIRNWIPASQSSRPAVADNTEETDSAEIGVYEVSIPAAQEPTPVWPPVTGELGPGRQIPVSRLDVHMPPQQPAISEGAETESIAASAPEAPLVASDLAFHEHHDSWSDGQLLTSTAQSDDGDEELFVEDDTESSAEAVWLKIAELEDQTDDAKASEEARPKSDSKQLFTLPIALDEVTGECEPLADSVREIQRDLDDFQGTERGTSLNNPIPGPLQKQPHTSPGQLPITEMTIESSSLSADELGSRLLPPQWISQTSQVISTAAPVAQLRPAAGAESYSLPETVAPALSVPDWSSPVGEETFDSEVSQETSSDDQSLGFRNLFTRIRRNRV